MSEDLRIAIDQWCSYALDVARLEQIHVREAMHWRDMIRAAGDDLDADDTAAIAAADKLFDEAAATVLPMLKYSGWLDRQPTEHYAREYASRNSYRLLLSNPTPHG